VQYPKAGEDHALLVSIRDTTNFFSHDDLSIETAYINRVSSSGTPPIYERSNDNGESADRSARSSYSTGTAAIADADRADTGTGSNQTNAHSTPSRTHPTEYARTESAFAAGRGGLRRDW
jgi:hypothetical protein